MTHRTNADLKANAAGAVALAVDQRHSYASLSDAFDSVLDNEIETMPEDDVPGFVRWFNRLAEQAAADLTTDNSRDRLILWPTPEDNR